MNTKSMLALVACSLLAVACGKSNDGAGNIARAIQGTAEENQVSQLSPSGETAVNAKVMTMDVRPEGSQKAVEEILAAFPDLSRDVTLLRSIDRVVSTQAGTLDLYAGEKLMIILEKSGETFLVRQAADTFTPLSIEHAMSTEKPDWVNSLDFIFRACRMEEKEQEQGKVEEEQKGQQEQEQKQQQEQKEEPVEICDSVRVHLDLEQIIEQQQEQEQKEEGKVEEEQKGQQEQGKGQQEEVVEKPMP